VVCVDRPKAIQSRNLRSDVCQKQFRILHQRSRKEWPDVRCRAGACDVPNSTTSTECDTRPVLLLCWHTREASYRKEVEERRVCLFQVGRPKRMVICMSFPSVTNALASPQSQRVPLMTSWRILPIPYVLKRWKWWFLFYFHRYSLRIRLIERKFPEAANSTMRSYINYPRFLINLLWYISVVIVNVVKSNPNKIPPPPPANVIKPYNPILDLPRPSKLENYLKYVHTTYSPIPFLLLTILRRQYDVSFLIDDSPSVCPYDSYLLFIIGLYIDRCWKKTDGLRLAMRLMVSQTSSSTLASTATESISPSLTPTTNSCSRTRLVIFRLVFDKFVDVVLTKVLYIGQGQGCSCGEQSQSKG